jgi:Tfp pilus assembly protein PilF
MTWARLQLASALLDANRPGEARRTLDDLPATATNHWLVFGIKGMLAAREGDLDSAAAHLHQSLILHDECGPTHFNLAQVLQRQGQWQRARESYERALTLTLPPQKRHAAMTAILELNMAGAGAGSKH